MQLFTFLQPGQLIDQELQLILIQCNPADPEQGYVPEYRFHMIHEQTREQMGEISLRIGHTMEIVQYAGHIGYRVYPEYRGHHYAARSVRLLKPFARRHQFQELWITCNPQNIASRRTCEHAGAVLVNVVGIPPEHDMAQRGTHQVCRYRLDL